MIPDLEDGVAYTSFLNRLKNKQLKFSPTEQKETCLLEALRKVANFIKVTEICAEGIDASKTLKFKGTGPLDR